MKGTFFEMDFWAIVLICLLIAIMWLMKKWGETFANPQLFFSNTADLSKAQEGGRVTYSALPEWLKYSAIGVLLLAFLDPHLQISKKWTDTDTPPTEGIAIYLVLDQSGSMTQTINAKVGGKMETVRKIDFLKQITKEFIEGDAEDDLSGRPNDLIGIVEFARTARVVVPLTLDHDVDLVSLANFDVIQNKEDDGTAIGYAIYKTANVIAATRHYTQDLSGEKAPAYDIKSAIMILVTDGFQAPSPLDKGNPLRTMDPMVAAQYAQKQGIKLYIVNVEPAFALEQFLPNRHIMEKVAELTGGKFYLIDSVNSLARVYADIDKLEKSRVSGLTNEQISHLSKDKQPHRYRRVSIYPYLIALGMFLLMLAIGLQTTVLRRIP